MCNYDTNFIQAVALKSRKAEELVRVFKHCYSMICDNSFTAQKVQLDNKISANMIQYIKKESLAYKIASPGNHHLNPAECAIQTFKN